MFIYATQFFSDVACDFIDLLFVAFREPFAACLQEGCCEIQVITYKWL